MSPKKNIYYNQTVVFLKRSPTEQHAVLLSSQLSYIEDFKNALNQSVFGGGIWFFAAAGITGRI